MKFQDLFDQIKKEARVSGDDEFVPVIVGLMNELFKEAVESQRPFELRAEVSIPLNAGISQVALPADFFINHQVLFNDLDTNRRYSLVDQDKAVPPAPRGLYGHPKSFEIASPYILLKPADAIITGDSLLLIYYKTPPVVDPANLIADNPIPRLEPFLIRGVIRRIRMLHSDDIQVANMLSGDVGSAAKSYTNDEPNKG